MPYLHCQRCHRTAWVRERRTDPVECRHCGLALEPSPVVDLRHLTTAVRERLAREARVDRSANRFVRPQA